MNILVTSIGYNCTASNCINTDYSEKICCVRCNTLDTTYFKSIDIIDLLVTVRIHCINCNTLIHGHSLSIGEYRFQDFIGSYLQCIKNPRLQTCMQTHTKFSLKQETQWNVYPASYYQISTLKCDDCNEILVNTMSPTFNIPQALKGCIRLCITKNITCPSTGA